VTATYAVGSLVGKLIAPNIGQRKQALIVLNTATTIKVSGDVTGYVHNGDHYQIIDYHLRNGSRALDYGDTASAPVIDFDGNARPGSDGLVDIGAYEANSAYTPVDYGKPLSQVVNLPTSTTNAVFDLPFWAYDFEGSVSYVRLYYRKDGGAWTQYDGTFTTSPIHFDCLATVGVGKYQLDFYTLATDNSGNLEAAPAVPDATILVALLPDLLVAHADIAPTAPVQMRPSDPIVLSAFIENEGYDNGMPFWIEVWGSRTGGLTLDRFLADSLRLPRLNANDAHSWITTAPLYSIPDGPYTVVYAVDRPGEVLESNERNNRAVVSGKRLLVIRPPTQIDLAFEGFGMSPNPANSGQQVVFSGRVVNRGSQASGPFWVEFWGSWDRPFPGLNFFLCDSIFVPNLGSSSTMDLASYPRPLYNVPTGTFTIGCFADRDDAINELDETNNYQFVDGQVFNAPASPTREANNGTTGPDIRIVAADFSPSAPTQLAPGDSITLTVDLINSGAVATGPFWLEYWGSRDGGVTLSDFVAFSDVVSNLAPGETRHISPTKPLNGIPDGPYSVVVFADRPDNMPEANKLNNRRVVVGKRLLLIRPPTGADLTIHLQTVNIANSPSQISFIGEVDNNGTADSGRFWIEFWLCPGDADYPWFDRFACDSILVNNVPAHGSLNLSSYHPLLYGSVPASEYTFIGFVDRLDQVIETDETNNYVLIRHFVVPAH
jgi:hypothetical protein